MRATRAAHGLFELEDEPELDDEPPELVEPVELMEVLDVLAVTFDFDLFLGSLGSFDPPGPPDPFGCWLSI